MTYLTDLFSSSLIQSIGWTLLHSLWQSLLCTVIVVALLRYIPSTFSNARYTIATVGLILTFFVSTGTFIYEMQAESPVTKQSEPSVYGDLSAGFAVTEVNSVSGLLMSTKSFIQSNIALIVAIWVLGAVLSSLRLFTGWWYLKKLRHTSMILNDEWSHRLEVLAIKIGINKHISLAESARIHAPIVIGYIKPIILLPVGMCSGLSTEQLESIFIHELIHIRRGDYVVNVIQALLEALFFFNPFVWIISGIMRREREHCCDDAVVKFHGNPLAYVRALATLEEVRLSNTGLALSLAENKNQLLNRIKRIMEKSVKNYSTRERVVPLVLLVVGLVCASWLTIQSGRPDESIDALTSKELASNDTTIKQKSTRYYRKSISIDENGDTNNVIEVEVEGDNELIDMFSIDNDFDFQVEIPAIPPMPDIAVIPPIMDIDVAIPPTPAFDFSFRMDTLSPPHGRFDGDWEEFSKEFEENFKDRFGEFYEKHEEELKSMMENMEFKFNHQFENDWTSKMEELALKQEQLAVMQELKQEQAEQLMAQHEIHAKSAQESVKQIEREHALRAKEMEQNMKVMEDQLKAHEKTQKALFKELTTELVKDGYIKEGEKINHLQITDNKIKVNDKEIKSADLKKYRALVEKYSTGPSEKELRKESSKEEKD